MCDTCRRDDARSMCPACCGTLRVVVDGLWCVECGYYQRLISEDTLAMTEVKKIGENKCFGTK